MPLDLEKKRTRDRSYDAEHREQRKAANKAYRAIPENRARELARKAQYNKARKFEKYGSSQEHYEALLLEQRGRCGICGTDSPGNAGRRWCLDHDHRTDAIRGLLCHGCNVGIGFLRDDPEVLRAAAFYIEQSRKQG